MPRPKPEDGFVAACAELREAHKMQADANERFIRCCAGIEQAIKDQARAYEDYLDAKGRVEDLTDKIKRMA